MENIKKYIIWVGVPVVVIFFVLLGMAESGYKSGALDILKNIFIVLILFLFAAVMLIINYIDSWQVIVKRWVSDNKLILSQNAAEMIKQRMDSNLGKDFFGARKLVDKGNNKIFVSGRINERMIWLYPFIGLPPEGSFLQAAELPTVRVAQNQSIKDVKFIKGWCLEIATYNIPLSMGIYRKYVSSHDEMDTESRLFEKLYNVDIKEGRGTLQLLDPVMIDLIIKSKISAFEFSDSSVVLYYTLYNPNRDQLDNMLSIGLKIAEQVDKNFPLGKYEKPN